MKWIFCRIQLAIVLIGFLLLSPSARAVSREYADLAGQLSDKLSLHGKKTVIVPDFLTLDGKVTGLGRYAAEEVAVSLVESHKGIELIDRAHLAILLREYKLAANGLINTENAQKIGEILGADFIITGTLIPHGDYIDVSAKVLDASTASIIAVASTSIPRTDTADRLMRMPLAANQAEKSPLDAPSQIASVRLKNPNLEVPEAASHCVNASMDTVFVYRFLRSTIALRSHELPS